MFVEFCFVISNEVYIYKKASIYPFILENMFFFNCNYVTKSIEFKSKTLKAVLNVSNRTFDIKTQKTTANFIDN